jgi:hypothetical protein
MLSIVSLDKICSRDYLSKSAAFWNNLFRNHGWMTAFLKVHMLSNMSVSADGGMGLTLPCPTWNVIFKPSIPICYLCVAYCVPAAEAQSFWVKKRRCPLRAISLLWLNALLARMSWAPAYPARVPFLAPVSERSARLVEERTQPWFIKAGSHIYIASRLRFCERIFGGRFNTCVPHPPLSLLYQSEDKLRFSRTMPTFKTAACQGEGIAPSGQPAIIIVIRDAL